MKLITRDSDYAVRILCYLADKDGMVPAADMTRGLKIPFPFLRRITQRLSNGGLLTSVKGLSGGFSLARPCEKIRLLDVIEIFQGPFQLNDCLFKKKICPNRKICFMRRQILDIEQYALDKFASLTIADIRNGRRPRAKKSRIQLTSAASA